MALVGNLGLLSIPLTVGKDYLRLSFLRGYPFLVVQREANRKTDAHFGVVLYFTCC